MNMPKSRDIQAKMPSPKVILNAFWLVTVKVLNSYNLGLSVTRRGVRLCSSSSDVRSLTYLQIIFRVLHNVEAVMGKHDLFQRLLLSARHRMLLRDPGSWCPVLRLCILQLLFYLRFYRIR